MSYCITAVGDLCLSSVWFQITTTTLIIIRINITRSQFIIRHTLKSFATTTSRYKTSAIAPSYEAPQPCPKYPSTRLHVTAAARLAPPCKRSRRSVFFLKLVISDFLDHSHGVIPFTPVSNGKRPRWSLSPRDPLHNAPEFHPTVLPLPPFKNLLNAGSKSWSVRSTPLSSLL